MRMRPPRSTSFGGSPSRRPLIAGLSCDTNEIFLKDASSQHGDVIEVKVICHSVTGESKGYGFVKFSSENEAAAALQKMSGECLMEGAYGCIMQTADHPYLDKCGCGGKTTVGCHS